MASIFKYLPWTEISDTSFKYLKTWRNYCNSLYKILQICKKKHKSKCVQTWNSITNRYTFLELEVFSTKSVMQQIGNICFWKISFPCEMIGHLWRGNSLLSNIYIWQWCANFYLFKKLPFTFLWYMDLFYSLFNITWKIIFQTNNFWVLTVSNCCE